MNSVRNTNKSEWILLCIVVAGIAIQYESYVVARSWNCSLRWDVSHKYVKCAAVLFFFFFTVKEQGKWVTIWNCFLPGLFFFNALDIECALWARQLRLPLLWHFRWMAFFCWCGCGVDLNSWCRYEVDISESRGHDFRNVLFTFWTRFHDRSQNNISHSCELKRTYFDINLTVHEENGRISHDYYWVGGDSPDVPTPNVNYLHGTELFTNNSLSISVEWVPATGTCYAFEMRLAGVSRPFSYQCARTNTFVC